MNKPRRLLFLAFFGAACASAACGATAARSRALSPYTGKPAELFDDGIETHAVELDLEGRMDPRIDPAVRERSQTGDAVVRAKVATVTRRTAEDGTSFDVEFRLLGRLAGAHPPDDPFTLHISPKSPSAGILKRVEPTLGGKTFVVFVKSFASAGGEAELHFHVAPDTKEEIVAVTDAAALAELR